MNTNYMASFSKFQQAQYTLNVEGVELAEVQEELLRSEEALKIGHAEAYLAAKASADKVTEAVAEATAIVNTKAFRASVTALRCVVIRLQAAQDATRRIRDCELEMARAIAAEVA